MRKFCFMVAVIIFAACNSNKESKVDSMKSPESDTTKPSTDNIAYPYMAEYSSKFEIGDPQHAKMILDLYKDWDNNTLDNSKNAFADYDSLHFSDGSMLIGPRDSVFESTKKFRNTLGTVKSVVQAWIPVKSTDRNESWVLVWVKELRTAMNGKMDSTFFQETWRINKDNKADLVFQYEQKSPPPPKK